jgi:hypothetical protein
MVCQFECNYKIIVFIATKLFKYLDYQSSCQAESMFLLLVNGTLKLLRSKSYQRRDIFHNQRVS